MIDLEACRTPDNIGEIIRRAEVARASYLKLLFKRFVVRFSADKAASPAPTAVRFTGAKA